MKSIRFYMKPKTGLEGSGKTAEMVGNTPFGTIETIGGKKLSVPGWKLCPLVLHYFPNMDVYSYINFAYVIEWSAFDGPDKSMNGKVVFAKPKTVSRSERVGFTPRYRTRYYQVPSEEKIVSFNFTVIPTGVINGDSAYSYFEKLRREKYNAIIKAIRK